MANRAQAAAARARPAWRAPRAGVGGGPVAGARWAGGDGWGGAWEFKRGAGQMPLFGSSEDYLRIGLADKTPGTFAGFLLHYEMPARSFGPPVTTPVCVTQSGSGRWFPSCPRGQSRVFCSFRLQRVRGSDETVDVQWAGGCDPVALNAKELAQRSAQLAAAQPGAFP